MPLCNAHLLSLVSLSEPPLSHFHLCRVLLVPLALPGLLA